MSINYIVVAKAPNIKDSIFTFTEYEDAKHIVDNLLEGKNNYQVIILETRIRDKKGLLIETKTNYFYRLST